ncbi:MAG: fumarylacetoacetate hydrolase family protein [Actinomycetota bacterium]|nr:fumarylacetoacetate hydrolase family protein [Actinomycetota bacterium]
MSISVCGLAARQLADYRARTPGTFFAEENRSRLTLDDAYAVQSEVARLRAAEGEPVAGYKVGCTGPNVREQFGMDGPIRGFVYETELRPSGAEISHASYANLAVEGELAVRLGDDAQIARILPVIELHNYVFRSEKPSLQELIANNGVHAGVVLPATEGAEWRGEEPLRGALQVEIGGRTVEEGRTLGVPGGPAGSVAWLRRHLAAHGLALRPHQLVLTGTPLGLYPVRPGDGVRVTVEGLGSVEATVVA